MTAQNIHQGQALSSRGASLADAKAAMIMIHGRGGGVNAILPVSNHFKFDDVAYLAPSANDLSWYPDRFLAPRQNNEPYLSSALETLTNLLKDVEEAGIPPEKTIILGFSQGACLATELAARNPKRYGGIVALSGVLIGADDELTGYEGSLNGTPVFLGCSNVDFHIPLERVHKTRDIMTGLGAVVDERIYEDMGHSINMDEISAVNMMIKSLL